jgi:hypothetical protein
MSLVEVDEGVIPGISCPQASNPEDMIIERRINLTLDERVHIKGIIPRSFTSLKVHYQITCRHTQPMLNSQQG